MQSCSRTATVSLKNPNFWTAISWQLTKDFISFMRDNNTSTWPQLPKQWLYLAPRDANNVQIYPVNEDFDMRRRYPKPKES